MTSHALFKDLKPVDVLLEDIYLDPNNPRFVGSNFKYTRSDRIDREAVQDLARQKLTQDFEVDKLRGNIEVNGYLPIDRVIVREFKPGKFVVLEGNRRICAAKLVVEAAEDGETISPEVLKSLKRIPCLQYVGTEKDASWIFQGLRHISGVLEWPAYNKARLLVEQMEEEGLTQTEVGKRFGISSYGAGLWLRGYYAFKQARENSDYGNDIDERSYTFFQELFNKSSSSFRDWLEWDDDKKEFKNLLNFNEFIGWLYPRPQSEEDELAASNKQGDWERRFIVRRDDLRKLAFLRREEPEYFERFRADHDLEKAYSVAQARKYEEQIRQEIDPVERVFESIHACTKTLVDIPYKIIRDDQQKNKLMQALKSLKEAISQIPQ